MVFQVSVFLIGLYIAAESLCVAAGMEGGDRLCRLSKYGLTALVGLCMMARGEALDSLHLAMGAALALFVWPKMVERWNTWRGL